MKNKKTDVLEVTLVMAFPLKKDDRNSVADSYDAADRVRNMAIENGAFIVKSAESLKRIHLDEPEHITNYVDAIANAPAPDMPVLHHE